MAGFLSIFRKQQGGPTAIPPPRTALSVTVAKPEQARPNDQAVASAISAPVTAADFAVKKLPQVVVAFDATISRQRAWEAVSRPLTDTMIAALPGEVEVALAVHSGGRVAMFTDFTGDAAKLRDQAARVTCKAGGTKLLPILKRVSDMGTCPVVIYIGDAYEEGSPRRVADALKHSETRVIILHDGPPPAAFGEIVDRTGGALLPFSIAAMDQLRDLLQAVAVLAIGGTELLETKQKTMPAATLLLENLSDRKLIGPGGQVRTRK